MRVLITGGLGFIGSNLAHRCLTLGADVAVYDSLDANSGGNMHNLDPIRHDVRVIQNDIRNFEKISEAIVGSSIVFHCAAFTSHPKSMLQPLLDIEINCAGVINLLEAVRRFQPNAKIVHVGTSTQHGPMRSRPIDEYHPEFPPDIYSANKSAAEKYVLIYARAYSLPATVLRLPNIFGPRSNIRNSDLGFINYFIGCGLQNKDIPVFGDGKQLRNVLFVDDAVDALIAAGLEDRTNGEVFHAASDDHYRISQLAHHISRVIGGRVVHIDWPKNRQVIETGDAVISNKKIRRFLSWKPSVCLNDGLRLTKEYFLPRLDAYL